VRIGQGRENAKAYLEEHGNLADEINERLRESLKAAVSTNGAAYAGSSARPASADE